MYTFILTFKILNFKDEHTTKLKEKKNNTVLKPPYRAAVGFLYKIETLLTKTTTTTARKEQRNWMRNTKSIIVIL